MPSPETHFTPESETERAVGTESPELRRSVQALFKSSWEKLRHEGLALAMSTAITFGAAVKAEATSALPETTDGAAESGQTQGKIRPRERVESTQSLEQKIATAKERYEHTKFEESEESTLELLKQLEDVTLSPEFKRLHPTEQAELLHRRAYCLKTFNDRYYFKGDYSDASQEDIRAFEINCRNVTRLAKEAIDLDLSTTGELTSSRERSVTLLLDNGQTMTKAGVRLAMDSPSLRGMADTLKAEGADVAQDALRIDPRTRHAGNGFFVFSHSRKNQELMPLVGLARYTGDVDKNMPEAEVVKIMGGAAYDIGDVVKWANEVRRGTFSAQTREQKARENAFIDKLTQMGLLKMTPNGIVKGNAEHIAFSPPDVEPFTHETAHAVQFENAQQGGDYLAKARREFERLQVSDKKLFRDFMRMQNPNLDEEASIEEFFAYSQQVGDWRKHAQRVVYGR